MEGLGLCFGGVDLVKNWVLIGFVNAVNKPCDDAALFIGRRSRILFGLSLNHLCPFLFDCPVAVPSFLCDCVAFNFRMICQC